MPSGAATRTKTGRPIRSARKGAVELWDQEWPAQKVKARLVEAFIGLPGRGVYRAGRGDYEVVSGFPVGHVELIEFCETALPLRHYRALITWAASRASGRYDFLEWARANGMSAKRATELVERGAAKVGRAIGEASTVKARRLAALMSA